MTIQGISIASSLVLGAVSGVVAMTGSDMSLVIAAVGGLITALGIAVPLVLAAVKSLRTELKTDIQGIAKQMDGINTRLTEKADAVVIALVKKSGQLDEAKGDPVGADMKLHPLPATLVQPPPEGTK